MTRKTSLLCLVALTTACSQLGETSDGPCGPEGCGLGDTDTTTDDGGASDALLTGGTGSEDGGGSATGGSATGGSSTATDSGNHTDSGNGTDSGNATDTDTTGDVVIPPACGDGMLDDGESCDDGEDNGTYGACALDCSGPGLRCGDGQLQADHEFCDAGADNGTYASGCNDDCSALAAYCGDGNVDAGFETCDDGNGDSNDGCDADCIPSGVTSIVAGNAHNCALTRTGDVKCWGYNGNGRLGYGNTDNVGDNEPPANVGIVQLGGSAVQLASGWAHNCALLNSGQVKCWGTNDSGQLGYGNTQHVGDDELPRAIGSVPLGTSQPPSQIRSGSSANHTCALFTNNAVKCWGVNAYGRLGLGHTNTIGDNETPALINPIALGVTIDEVELGQFHTCARLPSGGVRCWGHDYAGALGNGDTSTANIGDDADEIEQLTDIPEFTASMIAGGSHFTCTAYADDVRCWGLGSYGQLGTRSTENRSAPASERAPVLPTLATSTIRKLVAGRYHVCALYTNGDLRCWGYGAYGQLGYGNTENLGDGDGETANVVNVGAGVRVMDVVAGGHHTCASLSTGAVRCWGTNSAGQLGYGDTVNRIAVPADLPDIQLF